MKKLAFILFVILMVPCCAVYAQDCSERIQAAGRIYEKYKKTYDKKMFEEARKQLVDAVLGAYNAISTEASETNA